MKVELLLNDCNGQVLPIFEGNRGDSSQFKLCKSKNLITQHPRARRAPRVPQFMTRSKSQVGSYLALVSSFTRMPQWSHRGWPEHSPIVHM
jgi:hypothetical protein